MASSPCGTIPAFPRWAEGEVAAARLQRRDGHDQVGDAGCTRTFSFVVVGVFSPSFSITPFSITRTARVAGHTHFQIRCERPIKSQQRIAAVIFPPRFAS